MEYPLQPFGAYPQLRSPLRQKETIMCKRLSLAAAAAVMASGALLGGAGAVSADESHASSGTESPSRGVSWEKMKPSTNSHGVSWE